MGVDMVEGIVLDTCPAPAATFAVGTRIFAVDVLCHGAGEQEFARARRAVEQKCMRYAVVIDHINELPLYVVVFGYL